MKFRDKKLESPELNLTPLIDVVFLLLIFFMVSTSFDQNNQIKLKLPEIGQQAQSIVDDKVLAVAVNAAGEYFVNGQLLPVSNKQQLTTVLKRAMLKQADLILIISGDKSVNYQQVVDIMDVARQLGLVNIRLASSRKKQQP